MDSTPNEFKFTNAGEGYPSIGVRGVVAQAPLSSSSDACEPVAVDLLATRDAMASREGPIQGTTPSVATAATVASKACARGTNMSPQVVLVPIRGTGVDIGHSSTRAGATPMDCASDAASESSVAAPSHKGRTTKKRIREKGASSSTSTGSGTCVESESGRGDASSLSKRKRHPRKWSGEDGCRKAVTREGVPQLRDRVAFCLDNVERVASRSSNIKGEYVGMLRSANAELSITMQELCRRMEEAGEAEEARQKIARLEKRVAELSRRAEGLKEENSSLRAMKLVPPAALPPPSSCPPLHAQSERMESVAVTEPTETEMAFPAPLEKRGGDGLLRAIGELIDSRLRQFRKEISGTLGTPGTPGERRIEAARADARVEFRARVLAAASSSSSPSSAPVTGQEVRRKKRKRKKRKKKEQGGGATDGPGAVRAGAAVTVRPTQPPTEAMWCKVVGRKAARKSAAAVPTAAAAAAPRPGVQAKPRARGIGVSQLAKPPRAAAITLSAPEGATISVAEAMSLARSKINIAELGITGIRPKRAATGGLVLEVPGPESAAKADLLAQKMQEVLLGKGVRVGRPVKNAEMRVHGLDDSVTPSDVATAVASRGGCTVEEVRVGEMKFSSAGLPSVWVRCPLVAARTLATAGRLLVGWVSARVEILSQRPMRCFRCLVQGHVASTCASPVDRSNLCYRCCGAGHRASQCTADPFCPFCAERGRPAGHRMGTGSCVPPSRQSAQKGAEKRGPAVPSSGSTSVESTPMEVENTGGSQEGAGTAAK